MNTRWSDLTDASLEYGFKALVGDPKTDSARLTATSPLKQAAAITKPVLLAYGGADWRVPEQQGFALRNALQKHNNAVEWLYYKKEGHGWTAEATNIDFWTKLDAFLSKHLAAKP